jgi:hypothetical protein
MATMVLHHKHAYIRLHSLPATMRSLSKLMRCESTYGAVVASKAMEEQLCIAETLMTLFI